jgi:hypothetical protein
MGQSGNRRRYSPTGPMCVGRRSHRSRTQIISSAQTIGTTGKNRIPPWGARHKVVCSLQLHWNPQRLRRVCPESPLHQRSFSVSEHPPARTGAATRTGVSQHASVRSRPATEKESGSAVRRIEKSDRAVSSAPAEIEVRARAVLPDSGSSEHQALGALPQSADNTGFAGHHLVERGKENRRRHARR